MKILILETVALKPHLETSGEIAISYSENGHDVTWSWLGYQLPWTDWDIPLITKLFGSKLKKRIINFQLLLKTKNISIDQADEKSIKIDCKSFKHLNSFSGSLNDLKCFEINGVPIGIGVASSLISYFGDSNFNPVKHRRITRKSLISSYLVYLRALSLIEKYKPDEVITFNGRFATPRAIVLAAQKHNMKILRHERGSSYMRYEVFDENIHDFNYISRRVIEFWEKSTSDHRERSGHEFFIRKRRGDGIAWHSLVSEQKRGFFPDKVVGKKRIVYFSSSEDEFAAIADITSSGAWNDQVRVIRTLADACNHLGNFELIIRVHPNVATKSKQSQLKWNNLVVPNALLIKSVDTTDSYALLDSCDFVATFGSTIGLEAVYWGKPLLLFGPAPYSNSVIAFEPRTIEDIINFLKTDLLLFDFNMRKMLCLPYGYYYLCHGTLYKNYSPKSLSQGRFLDQELTWKSGAIIFFEKLRLKNFYYKFKKALGLRNGF
ncbi:MAG: hypothetical protein COW00_00805 [Bdellovibrio sp. CG12_big_fil_rev_8_21_14_0_65_39_13]|nr:MAG: hypothetical protein COW78_20395 [Bdellovibrio sp. CG22_combo_CG10-13_8_21_14_all_39_27]PIQ62794.1 MAG: hypothetical protein COW00_00805 [Bdellovibrio sp. CG12_big_fil_rev_8_21_14_0_65_39_13]PIR32548.1 MAG: hypothetical protein COV37_19610 [Bdellovibrio sp. CG11_big_fil_rev_8_21_14_0_20_39_38]